MLKPHTSDSDWDFNDDGLDFSLMTLVEIAHFCYCGGCGGV